MTAALGRPVIGAPLPTFNPFDPVGSWLSDLTGQIADAITAMFASVMSWVINQGDVGFTSEYFVRTYTFTLSLAFFVGLPLVLLTTFAGQRRTGKGAADMWDALLVRLPRFMVLAVFGVSIGQLISAFIAALNRSIIDYTFGGSAEDLSDTLSNVIVSAMTGATGSVMVALVLGLLLLVAVLCLFLSALLVSLAAQILGVLFPLFALADVSRGFRGVTKKFYAVTAVVFLIMPAQLLLLGFFFGMLSDTGDALTVPGAAETALSGDSVFGAAGQMVAATVALLLPALAPLAMLRFVSSGASMATGGGEGGGSSSAAGEPAPSSATPNAQSPQQVSMGATSAPTPAPAHTAAPAQAATAGGPSAAAPASAATGGGGAAAAGGAGTAATAAGAGAATGGVGAVAVAGLSAAGRMAHGLRMETSGGAQRSAQSMSMASFHAASDGGED